MNEEADGSPARSRTPEEALPVLERSVASHV